jgi:hypothetical protein
MDEIKILFTDLDGTLLKNDSTLSCQNKKALNLLSEENIKTVIATGRNLHSAIKVLPNDLKIDYLMFSSGCGIMNWKSGKIIYENHLENGQIEMVISIFKSHRADFMIHLPIPESNKFFYHQFGEANEYFARRIKLYDGFAKKMYEIPHKASQLIAIFPFQEIKKFTEIKDRIEFLTPIRTTSPLDHKSIWLEIFPLGVSKGNSARWLCEHLNISPTNALGVGNDFNDIDLLDFTGFSYVVANAPQELKTIYASTGSNEEDGFAGLIKKIF